MASVDLSVIIPIKNNSRQLSDLIGSLAEELCDLEAEFIIIDMNSSDDSVIRALDEIKRQKLRGCVIQSGGGINPEFQGRESLYSQVWAAGEAFCDFAGYETLEQMRAASPRELMQKYE